MAHQAPDLVLLHLHQGRLTISAIIRYTELVGVEPTDEEIDDERQRLSARLLDLKGEAGQWLGEFVVGTAAIEKVGEDRRDRFEPPAVSQVVDGLGGTALIGSDAPGEFLDR